MSKAWSGGERVGSPVSGPAFGGLLAPGVIRRSGAARPSLLRRVCDATDWGYARFALGFIATGLVLLHVAIGRAG